MKYIRVKGGRFHSDPPRNNCGVLSAVRAQDIHEWHWANIQIGFDPIQYGVEALSCPNVVHPCLHCFPACKPKGQL